MHTVRDYEQENLDAAHTTLNLWNNRKDIPVLGGQTIKQPTVWRCQNPDCLEDSTHRFFEFESEKCECPKCGLGHPAVLKRALIHLLIRDNKGPIMGDMGLRYRLGCSPSRAYLATINNGEAATGLVEAANCPGCLKAVGESFRVNGLAMGIRT